MERGTEYYSFDELMTDPLNRGTRGYAGKNKTYEIEEERASKT